MFKLVIYIYKIECMFVCVSVCLCMCVFHSTYFIFKDIFKKSLCHLIEKLSGSVLVKSEQKYL